MGVLGADVIKDNDMKEKIEKEDKAQILTGSQNTRKSSNLTKISQWHRRF